MSVPTTHLTRKGEFFEWTEKRGYLFQKMKRYLATAPDFHQSHYGKAFLVECGASWVGLGGALHKRYFLEGRIQEVHVLFISRDFRGG